VFAYRQFIKHAGYYAQMSNRYIRSFYQRHTAIGSGWISSGIILCTKLIIPTGFFTAESRVYHNLSQLTLKRILPEKFFSVDPMELRAKKRRIRITTYHLIKNRTIN
ncbi:MAG: hypothetical protein M0Q92_04285, partial [Methanoregula sp.]|nr:hypothetical protein [Methanoregula sp.]